MLTVVMTEDGLEGGVRTPGPPELNFVSTPVPRDRQADAVDLRLEPAALDLSFSDNSDKRHECPDDTRDAFRSGFALGRLQDYFRDRRYTL